MYAIPTIPGVKLEVYKEDRLLSPESDGYVHDGYGNNLFSGSATILAVVSSDADKTIGIFRQGGDQYDRAWDWLVNINQIPHPRVKEQQERRQAFLGNRSFQPNAHVYGVKIPLRVFSHAGPTVNTVHYPENMLMLAQYVQDGGRLTGRVWVWEAALVSQHGKFFLTVHRHYDMFAGSAVRGGKMFFPRLRKHRLLERILVENAPDDLPMIPGDHTVSLPRNQAPEGLGRHEAIVENWYSPRNMGCILTSQGPARVHWSDVPVRPRLRYLKEGEKVRFTELRVPHRKSQNELSGGAQIAI